MIAGLRRALARIRARSARLAADVDAEVEHHIEMRARRFMARGMSAQDAWLEARRRFGPAGTTQALVAAAHERERHMHWTDRIEGLAGDLRHATRQLRRSPGFTATATITLALGIGANATMFAIVNRLLLQPPSGVVDPRTVVSPSLTRTFSGPGQPAMRDTQAYLSYPLYTDLLRSGAFARVAAYRARTLTLGDGAAARLVHGVATTAAYFPALGVRPESGRFYSSVEADQAPGANVVVLSHAFWVRQFGADPATIGRTLTLAGTGYRVVGVAPAGFAGLETGAVDLWIPFTAGISAQTLDGWKHGRQSFFLLALGRLKPGVPLAVAAHMGSAAVHAGFAADGMSRRALDSQDPGIALVSALPLDARGHTAEGRVAVLLAGVALLVLILACANVANLQVTRTIRRRQEIAVRLALGVARRRLLRQLALDSVLLALLGGLAAVAIAYVGGEVARRSLAQLGLGATPLVDGRVLAFTALVSTVAGLATGLLPALQATRLSLITGLRSGVRDGGGHSSRLRGSLLVLQACLTVLLLAGTGAFLVSLRRVQNVPLGVEPDSVLRVSVVTAGRSYSDGEKRDMYKQLLRAALAMPGVRTAALATSMPFESASGTSVFLPGRDSVPTTREGGPYDNTVTSQFFQTLGTHIVAGRGFRDDDRAGSAPVVIVNQTAARMWWPGESALGKCVKIGADSMPCAEVVGIAENARRFGIIEDEAVQYYAPLDQDAFEGPPNALYVRPRIGASAFQTQLQRRLQSAVPGLLYVSVEPLSDVIAPRMKSWRMGAVMFGIFGALAVLLASVGLYGMLAYDVAQRRHEIGVRMALGASRGGVAAIVVRRALGVMATGSAIGLAATLACGTLVEPLLFHTSARDPLILAAVLLIVLVVSLAASLIPTTRATRVHPASALRGG